MSIEKDKVVILTYELKANSSEGDLLQKVDEQSPFGFLFGNGQVIPGFEENLQGKTKGDTFSFKVNSQDAYGEVNEQAIVDVTKEIFNSLPPEQAAELMQVGKTLHLKDQEGNPLEGKILSIGDDSLQMDFNHPLAGVDLHFSGRILEVRSASSEEIAHGHVHGTGGVSH